MVPLYSSTNSDQRGGKLGYGTLDLGWLLKVARFGFGFFTGYHFYSERLTAFGCVQTATPVTPYICAPPIPDLTTVIRQNTTWHALRLGFNTEWKITPRWKLATDVAWLPIVHLSTWDTHLLRPDLVGSTPQSSVGFSSWQLEAILSYDFTNEWSVGLGHAIGNSILTRKCISKGVRAASHSQQLFKPSGGVHFFKPAINMDIRDSSLISNTTNCCGAPAAHLV